MKTDTNSKIIVVKIMDDKYISRKDDFMKVEIYGTSWCGPCQQAKKLCDAKGIPYEYTDVDDTASLRQLEERLGHKVKSIPHIFLNSEHLATGINGLQEALNTAH